ncbi:MAG: hypothetical protein R2864_00470 [Syntrophotaleaceae bacterium]
MHEVNLYPECFAGLLLATTLPASAAGDRQELDDYRLLVWLVTALLGW